MQGVTKNKRGWNRRLTKDMFILRARKVHGELYGYDQVVYQNNTTPIDILCRRCDKLYSQKPANHLAGKGCRDCSNKQRGDQLRMTLDQFITNARKIHGEAYDYSHVVYNTNLILVDIACRKCNVIFKQTPGNHLSGHGCRKCGCDQRGLNMRSTQEEFIARARHAHGDLYDYTDSVYVTILTKTTIKCRRCQNVFRQTPANHLKGQGCVRCSDTDGANARRKTLDQFIDEAKALYPDGRYSYTKTVYVDSITKSIITCNICGDDFEQTPDVHLSGRNGCVRCRRAKRESDGAANCRRYLTERNIPFVTEYILPGVPKRRYDFLFQYNSQWYILEYDGDQHFRRNVVWCPDDIDFQKNQEVDKFKSIIAIASGCIILRISCDDYEHIVKVMNYFLTLNTRSIYIGLDSITKYQYLFGPPNMDLIVTKLPKYIDLAKYFSGVRLDVFSEIFTS